MNILLNEEAIKLLEVRRLPGRLTVGQATTLLGFNSIDLPVLISKRLLRPLGNAATPPPWASSGARLSVFVYAPWGATQESLP